MTLKPLGLETQLNNVLFGQSTFEALNVAEKVAYVTHHINEISHINGSKIYYPIVEGNHIYYCLLKVPEGVEAIILSGNKRKYYYPIQYANIEFGN